MANSKSTRSRAHHDSAFDWRSRLIDYKRHVDDLRAHSYEGAVSREQREEVFLRAFELTTPVARRVLTEMNHCFLAGTGSFRIIVPARSDEGGLIGAWELSWPLQQKARDRFNQEPLPPLAMHAVYPLQPTLGMAWTHPHFAMLRPGCHEGFAAAWPMQVVCEADAWRQEPILRVLAEADLHERTFLGDLNWKLLPSLYGKE
jgi:hypothetical protein